MRDLLAYLTEIGAPWAIATSARIESARPTLERLGVPSNVPIITRDQVQHAKPDPDLFLAAAERLGVPIHESVVVGDSVWDLLAARRARALGVGLLSGGYGEEELATPVRTACIRIRRICCGTWMKRVCALLFRAVFHSSIGNQVL